MAEKHLSLLNVATGMSANKANSQWKDMLNFRPVDGRLETAAVRSRVGQYLGAGFHTILRGVCGPVVIGSNKSFLFKYDTELHPLPLWRVTVESTTKMHVEQQELLKVGGQYSGTDCQTIRVVFYRGEPEVAEDVSTVQVIPVLSCDDTITTSDQLLNVSVVEKVTHIPIKQANVVIKRNAAAFASYITGPKDIEQFDVTPSFYTLEATHPDYNDTVGEIEIPQPVSEAPEEFDVVLEMERNLAKELSEFVYEIRMNAFHEPDVLDRDRHWPNHVKYDLYAGRSVFLGADDKDYDLTQAIKIGTFDCRLTRTVLDPTTWEQRNEIVEDYTNEMFQELLYPVRPNGTTVQFDHLLKRTWRIAMTAEQAQQVAMLLKAREGEAEDYPAVCFCLIATMELYSSDEVLNAPTINGQPYFGSTATFRLLDKNGNYLPGPDPEVSQYHPIEIPYKNTRRGDALWFYKHRRALYSTGNPLPNPDEIFNL